MTEPDNNKTHAGEIIGGLIVFAGVGVAGIDWWLGSTFWNSLGQAFLFVLAGGLVVMMGDGLRTGKLGIKGGYVYRDKNPLAFWLFLLFYGVVVCAFLGIAVIFTFIEA